MTPGEVRELRLEEWAAMVEHMNDEVRRRKRSRRR